MSESENKGTRIKPRNVRPYSSVPDSILTDKSLSTTARLTLAYMIGRGESWVFYVRQVQTALGLSESRWASVRRELEAAGYLKQVRRQVTVEDKAIDKEKVLGRWIWEIEVYDTPTTPENSTHENSIHGKLMDGKPVHGKPGDITKDCKQSDLNKGLETSLEREEPLRGSQALSLSSSSNPNPNSKANPNPKAVSRKVVGDEAWSFPTAWRDFARKERHDLSEEQIEHLIEKFTGYYSGTQVNDNDRLFSKWKGWVVREVVQVVQVQTGMPGALPTNGTHGGYAGRDYGKGGLL
ncbi:MAG: hypothetical protein WAX67_01040 [Rugosibacter sp.]